MPSGARRRRYGLGVDRAGVRVADPDREELGHALGGPPAGAAGRSSAGLRPPNRRAGSGPHPAVAVRSSAPGRDTPSSRTHGHVRARRPTADTDEDAVFSVRIKEVADRERSSAHAPGGPGGFRLRDQEPEPSHELQVDGPALLGTPGVGGASDRDGGVVAKRRALEPQPRVGIARDGPRMRQSSCRHGPLVVSARRGWCVSDRGSGLEPGGSRVQAGGEGGLTEDPVIGRRGQRAVESGLSHNSTAGACTRRRHSGHNTLWIWYSRWAKRMIVACPAMASTIAATTSRVEPIAPSVAPTGPVGCACGPRAAGRSVAVLKAFCLVRGGGRLPVPVSGWAGGPRPDRDVGPVGGRCPISPAGLLAAVPTRCRCAVAGACRCSRRAGPTVG